MFKGLQKKWKVGSGRLLLILLTFALGGSLTGYLGKKIMSLTGIANPAAYIPVYILLITLLWPFLVLLISIPTGQFMFFKKYISKLGSRMGLRGQQSTVDGLPARQEDPRIEPLKAATSSQKTSTKRIVIFASGAGSNAQKIIDHFRHSPTGRVVLMACNKAGAGVVNIAATENIPLLMIEKERFFRGDGYVSDLRKAGVDLVVLAGFLWKIPRSLIEAYPRRIINIHPALLPKYGGKGMYGKFVHEAVVGAGEAQSGITIHYVDEHYDNGDVIFQAACPVVEGDTAEKLAARIHQMEHLHYPRVIEDLVRGMGDDGMVRL